MHDMKLKFSKMQGLGNDFVVIDAIRQSVDLMPEQVRRIADRHFGVGCDQLLLVEKPGTPEADFRYRIFNADGSEVEQCGNGARCFVRFVHEQGLTDDREIRVETASGIIRLRLEDDGLVTVDMGIPRFDPGDLPFTAEPALQYALQVGAVEVQISALSMGNPHAVQIVGDVDSAPVCEQGAMIERHQRFPQRVNAGFMQLIDAHHVKLRVFERGAGETLACGTGACAAAVAGVRLGRLVSPVTVSMRGGELLIDWAGAGKSVMMTGPAVTVFDGEITL